MTSAAILGYEPSSSLRVSGSAPAVVSIHPSVSQLVSDAVLSSSGGMLDGIGTGMGAEMGDVEADDSITSLTIKTGPELIKAINEVNSLM
jgi:hypothetical protein